MFNLKNDSLVSLGYSRYLVVELIDKYEITKKIFNKKLYLNISLFSNY
jgi:hypothetical protein